MLCKILLSHKVALQLSLLGFPLSALSQASVFCLVFDKAHDGRDDLLRSEQTLTAQCISSSFTADSFCSTTWFSFLLT